MRMLQTKQLLDFQKINKRNPRAENKNKLGIILLDSCNLQMRVSKSVNSIIGIVLKYFICHNHSTNIR